MKWLLDRNASRKSRPMELGQAYRTIFSETFPFTKLGMMNWCNKYKNDGFHVRKGNHSDDDHGSIEATGETITPIQMKQSEERVIVKRRKEAPSTTSSTKTGSDEKFSKKQVSTNMRNITELNQIWNDLHSYSDKIRSLRLTHVRITTDSFRQLQKLPRLDWLQLTVDGRVCPMEQYIVITITHSDGTPLDRRSWADLYQIKYYGHVDVVMSAIELLPSPVRDGIHLHVATFDDATQDHSIGHVFDRLHASIIDDIKGNIGPVVSPMSHGTTTTAGSKENKKMITANARVPVENHFVNSSVPISSGSSSSSSSSSTSPINTVRGDRVLCPVSISFNRLPSMTLQHAYVCWRKDRQTFLEKSLHKPS
jgi:hypothetical protein